MEAYYVRARVDLQRHRRVVGVVGTVDLASLLLFIAFEITEFDAPGDWFDEHVVHFKYLDSLFDVFALTVFRFLLLLGYSFNLPVLRYFVLPFFVCLCSVPYVAVKALFFGIESAGWQALAAVIVGLAFALLESYLLGTGMALHLRRHDPLSAKPRASRGCWPWSAPSQPAWDAPLGAGASASLNADATEATALLRPFSPDRSISAKARSMSVVSSGWTDGAAAETDFATPPESPALGASYLSGTSPPTVITAQTLHMPAAQLPSAQLHRLVEPGVQLTWNNQLDAAHTALATGAAYSPRHALHLAEISLVRQAITGRLRERDALLEALSRVDALVPTLLNNTAQLEEYANRVRQESGHATPGPLTVAERQNWLWDLKIVVADTALWRAITQLGAGQEIRGAFNLRRAWKLYESLQAEVEAARTEGSVAVDPAVYHALLFGVGLFYFLVSIVPGTFLTILQALGFKADRDRGVRMLQTVHEHGGVRSPIAALVLLANYLFIPRALTDVKALLGHAGPVIRSSMVKYPNGTLFLMMASHYARKTGEVDDAIPYLMRAIDECDRLHLAPNVYWNELGLCHFMKLDWPRAAEVFERLVFSGDKEFEFKAFVALQLSACYIGMNRNTDATALIAQIPSFMTNKSNRLAKMAKLRFERLIRQQHAPFLPYELLYLRRDMAHMGSTNLAKLVEHLDALEPESHKSADLRAQFILLKGAALKFLGRREEALQLFGTIKPLEPLVVDERYTIPFTYYEVGEIEYHRGHVPEAEAAFRYVANFGGVYDFSDVLRNRINLCFAHIDKERKQASAV